MYEHRRQRLARPEVFRARLIRNGLLAAALLAAGLCVGIAGYHWLVRLSWLDSLLNASMILGGMGPVDPITSGSGKVFASFYALFSGVVILGVSGVVFAPLFHRFLHRFHAETD